MSFTATLFDSGQLYFDIPEAQKARLWEQSQSLATPVSRWNAYLNAIALEAVLPWLREEGAARVIVPQSNQCKAFWELVNGTPVRMGGHADARKLVLIPSEAIDLDELAVPQEWVDIPEWAADDYVAVQVNLDEGWVRLWGHASHQQLKAQGELDWSDRSYRLPQESLSGDLSLLSLGFDPDLNVATARAELAAIQKLDLASANAMIERLGNPEQLQPRLAIPFERWSALVVHGGYRQRLAERRWGLPEQRSVMDWMRSGLSAMAEQSGWRSAEMEPAMVGVRRLVTEKPVMVRSLTIDETSYELRVSPLGELEENRWRVMLRSLEAGSQIPAGYVLRLLTEDFLNFEGNEDRAEEAVDELYLDVQLESGEGLIWMVDPLPEEYDLIEILRF